MGGTENMLILILLLHNQDVYHIKDLSIFIATIRLSRRA